MLTHTGCTERRKAGISSISETVKLCMCTHPNITAIRGLRLSRRRLGFLAVVAGRTFCAVKPEAAPLDGAHTIPLDGTVAVNLRFADRIEDRANF